MVAQVLTHHHFVGKQAAQHFTRAAAVAAARQVERVEAVAAEIVALQVQQTQAAAAAAILPQAQITVVTAVVELF
jgi:hypothetical protein